MFDVWCDREGRRVLLFANNIVGINNVDGAIEVAFRCHCGHEGTLLTGRGARVGASAR